MSHNILSITIRHFEIFSFLLMVPKREESTISFIVACMGGVSSFWFHFDLL
ncbi:hypothetical protein C2W64_04725 [Brevibacillus laterosporus]|nr:hypothetical protein C2W64_04725 [Brevibacillus laterosporus]